jgi:hypothetical protein
MLQVVHMAPHAALPLHVPATVLHAASAAPGGSNSCRRQRPSTSRHPWVTPDATHPRGWRRSRHPLPACAAAAAAVLPHRMPLQLLQQGHAGVRVRGCPAAPYSTSPKVATRLPW